MTEMGRCLEKRRLALIVAALGVVALPALVHGQAVLLKSKLIDGCATFLETREVCTRTVTGGPHGSIGTETKIEQIFCVLRTVESKPNQPYRIRLVFDRLVLRIENDKELISFDSDVDGQSGGSPMLAAVFGPMVGMSMEMEMDAGCRVTSFRGLDAIFAKLERTAPDNPFLAHLKKNLGDDVGRILWGEARTVLLPNRMVVVGDTWKSGFRQPCAVTGATRFGYNCRVVEIGERDGRKSVVVAYDAKIAAADEAGVRVAIPHTVYGLTGMLKGIGVFDVQRGDLISDTGELKISMEIALPSDDGGEAEKLRIEQVCHVTAIVMTPAERQKQKLANRMLAKARQAQSEHAPQK